MRYRKKAQTAVFGRLGPTRCILGPIFGSGPVRPFLFVSEGARPIDVMLARCSTSLLFPKKVLEQFHLFSNVRLPRDQSPRPRSGQRARHAHSYGVRG